MAISRAQLKAAVERYLPRTVNFSRSSDLGERDDDSVFERILQVILTSLLVDDSAVFYVVYLATQRLIADVDAAIESLDTVIETLQSIVSTEPTRISDYSQLEAAQTALVRLSSDVVSIGVFGAGAVADLQAGVEGFLATELVPNVAAGNRVAQAATLRSSMEDLKVQWEAIVSRRERLFEVYSEYTDVDLRAKVTAFIIGSIQEKVAELLDQLPAMTTAEQAAMADDIAIDLAAAEAAINIIAAAGSPTGTVTTGPSNTGFTRSSYLSIEGRARVEPVEVLRSGTDGRLVLTGPDAGAPVASIGGQTIAPISGTLTFEIEDASIPDFVAAGIEVGMFLTFVDAGSTHAIKAVAADKLTIDPAVRHQPATSRRYAVTDVVPGSLFGTDTGAYWTDYAAGSGASTLTASGSLGRLPRVDKASDTDGTNIQASGVAGVFRPRKANGSTSDSGGGLGADIFEDLNATLLSDQVAPLDFLVITSGTNAGTYIVAAVLSETQLQVAPPFPGGDSGANTGWYVEDPDTGDWFFDASAEFLTDGVTTGSTLRSGGVDYQVTDVLSQTLLEITGGPFVFNSGESWQVRTTANDVLLSELDFFGLGVTVGDLIDITGQGTKTITDVSVGFIELDSALSGVSLSGLSFSIYSPPGTFTNRFVQGDGVNFNALKIGASIEVDEFFSGVGVEVLKPTLLTVGGVTYSVQGRDPSAPNTTLALLPLISGVGSFTTSTSLVTEGVDLTAAGVDPTKHELLVVGGPNNGTTFQIVAVTTTTITVSGATVSTDDSTFQVWPKVNGANSSWSAKAGEASRRFVSLSPAFTAADVGTELIYDPGPSEIRTQIGTYVSATQVWLSDEVPNTSRPFAVVRDVSTGASLVAAGRTYQVLSVRDASTLEVSPALSNSAGTGIEYQVLRSAAQERAATRLYDPDGAALWDPVDGFTSDLVGRRIDVMLDRPTSTVVTRVVDADDDGFNETIQVRGATTVGRRSAPYRILSGNENTATVFYGETGAEVNSTLTVWTLPGTYSITAVDVDELTVVPPLPAKQRGLVFVTVTGGALGYGRYVLYHTKNTNTEVADDTDLLRLRVAEVLTDFGSAVTPITSGATGIVAGDTDGDGLSTGFTDSGADFSGASVGDKLTVTYGGNQRTAFVTLVPTTTRLRVDPPLPVGTALSWTLGRNSVSASLGDAYLLRGQLVELRQLLTEYVVERNTTVASVVELLEDQGLDKLRDMLYDGEIRAFINATRVASSYASAARSGIQGVGSSTVVSQAALTQSQRPPTRQTTQTTTAGQAALAGTGVSTTTVQVASSTSTGPSTAASGGSIVVPGEVETRIALARGINDIADDELLRSVAVSTFEEQRNRAIYELTGEVESGVISDTDPTLPWIALTGSVRDRLEARYQKVKAALAFMRENPDLFDDVESE